MLVANLLGLVCACVFVCVAHPSQIMSMKWADAIWTALENTYPSFLGPVNPHNAEITSLFGNQGGY